MKKSKVEYAYKKDTVKSAGSMPEKKERRGWNLDNSYSKLPDIFYSVIKPQIVENPQLAVFNIQLAEELGLDGKELEETKARHLFSGNLLPEGSRTIAQAYAGHQFGYFTMLGDGRAILLGEQITPGGERFDIQLKGSGATPYSRGGDGRAALGPMLREYIISEAMYALGIPTTRSLAVTTTGESIYREKVLDGAVLTRVAQSHIRIGTFEYASHFGTLKDLKKLTDYTIKRHFAFVASKKTCYLDFLKEVVKRQASLIAKWQLTGFVHGVMNTDNILICGDTIDYGPCAFMDIYEPSTVFSSIDKYGRYSYNNQPNITVWNLLRFAEALSPLLSSDREEGMELGKSIVLEFSEYYYRNYLEGMRKKLGIFNHEQGDEELIGNLLIIMKKHNADFTNTFLALTFSDTPDINKYIDLEMFRSAEFMKWFQLWKDRLSRQQEQYVLAKKMMMDSNPEVIPRNHRVEEVLKEAVENKNYDAVSHFVEILSKPYAHLPQQEKYTTLPSDQKEPYRTYCGT